MQRRHALDAVAEIAADQGGYLTSTQAGRLGADTQTLHRLVATGDLRRVRRGVYAFRTARDPFEPEIAAWLSIDRGPFPWEWDDAAVPRAVLSHKSAASIWSLGTVISELPAVTVPRNTTRAPFEIHTAVLGPTDWTWHQLPQGARVPVTTPERTIIDLAVAGEEPDYVERALSEALSRGLATREGLVRASQRKARGGPAVARLLDSASEAT